jgi:Dolichyl-phosphate-mannose-protein mannosyltransferase
MIAVLVLGVGLRAVTLRADAPYATYIDEHFTLEGSAHQIAHATWNPDAYFYPSFLMDATTLSASALAAVRGDSDTLSDGARVTLASPYDEVIEPWNLILAGRTTVLVLAAANIVLVALLGTRIASRRVGLIAAFFVAVLPIFVIRGSTVTVDTPAAFFATGALYCSARVMSSSTRRQLMSWSVLGGVASGLAFTSKYTTATVFLGVFIVIMLRRDRSISERFKAGLAAAVGFMATAVTIMPALVLRASDVIDALRAQERVYTTRTPTESYWQQLLHAREFGRLILFAGFIGLVLLALSRRARPVLIAYVAFAIPTMVVFARPGFQPVRNVLPLIPFLCIAAATTIVEAVRFIGSRARLARPMQWAVAAGFALLLCWAPVQGGTRTYISSHREHVDTRTTLQRWLTARVNEDERVLVAEELAVLPGQLRRICAHVDVGSQRRSAPVDAYDWVVLGDMNDPRWGSPWTEALSARQESWTIGDYPTSGSNEGLRIKTQPLEQVWHDNRQRIHVYGPDDALARSHRPEPCSSGNRTLGTLADSTLVVEPGRIAASEGNAGTTVLPVPISLSNPSSGPITVSWRTLSPLRSEPDFDAEPAEEPADYLAGEGTVTFPAGETSAAVDVTVNGDTEPESDEFVLVSFHTAQPEVRVRGLYGLGVGVIRNDD